MISRFTILYNRTRQAVITGELVEIITVRVCSAAQLIHANHITGCHCFRGHVNTIENIALQCQPTFFVCSTLVVRRWCSHDPNGQMSITSLPVIFLLLVTISYALVSALQ